MGRYSLVEVFGEQKDYKCGYCKSSDTNNSYGMWAHFLTCLDYENLLNRGWRRSGKYLYKPTMHLTCCPAYTIKCHALEFKLSKSQKKILKRFNHYLMGDKKEQDEEEQGKSSKSKTEVPADSSESQIGSSSGVSGENITSSIPENFQSPQDINPQDVTMTNISEQQVVKNEEGHMETDGNINIKMAKSSKTSLSKSEKSAIILPNVSSQKTTSTPSSTSTTENLNQGKLPDDSEHMGQGRCRKKKEIRLERKKQKLISKGIDPSTVSLKKQPSLEHLPKDLEDLLVDNNPESKRKLVVKTVSVTSPEFETTFEQEFQLYKSYQIHVHNDEESDCTRKQFKRFLCDSPLIQTDVENGFQLGSFHQQYYIDGELIAVGVLDVLPSCVSSVYFFYSPNHMFLSLGNLGALKEIGTVREWHNRCPSIKYYYMGFYIHSCPKMRYKGNYNPSYLLCPEVYTWHLLDDTVRNKLNASKYCRLNEDSTIKLENVNYKLMAVLYEGHKISFMMYQVLNKRAVKIETEVQKFANLLGPQCVQSLVVYLDSLKVTEEEEEEEAEFSESD